jgi:hypothetical protein
MLHYPQIITPCAMRPCTTRVLVPLFFLCGVYCSENSLGRGRVWGTDARCNILNKRWRVVPSAGTSSIEYDWVLQSRAQHIVGSPYTLKLFLSSGVTLERSVRCPLLVKNYLCVETPNLQGVDELFQDNIVYHEDELTCVMQHTWLIGPPIPSSRNMEGQPYAFVCHGLMRCIAVPI